MAFSGSRLRVCRKKEGTGSVSDNALESRLGPRWKRGDGRRFWNRGESSRGPQNCAFAHNGSAGGFAAFKSRLSPALGNVIKLLKPPVDFLPQEIVRGLSEYKLEPELHKENDQKDGKHADQDVG